MFKRLSKYIENKTIYIVRGLPGSGKNYFIYYNENNINDSSVFGICSPDKFIRSEKNPVYSSIIGETQRKYSINLFRSMIKHNVKRIYVVGDFVNPKNYSDFLELAKYKYYVKIIEILCHDSDHLNYFSKRTHKPIKKIINNANDWKFDLRAQFYNPYIPLEKFEGDSLPSHMNYTQHKEKLDKDLNYIRNKLDNNIEFKSASNEVFFNWQENTGVNPFDITFVSKNNENNITEIFEKKLQKKMK